MSLMDCIIRIPGLLEKRVDAYSDIEKSIKNLIRDREIKEIIFVASGTSLNSANVTKYFSKEVCNINLSCYNPNTFLNYYQVLKEDALYIFISQGGSTKLVYDSLNLIKSKGLLNISITEKIDSPIAKLADLAVEMGSENEEYLYRTIGYSTTVSTCCLIELAIAKILGNISDSRKDEVLEDFKLAYKNLDFVRETSDKWFKDNMFSLMKRNKCILAGASYLCETSNEADIKIMEMVPMMTRSFELEELIHGPQNAFDDNTIFFLLGDQKFDLEKIKSIKNFIKNEIGFCSIVGDIKVDERDLYFEYKSINFRMLEIITAFQVISYHLAISHGRDLSRGVNTTVNNYIKKTL